MIVHIARSACVYSNTTLTVAFMQQIRYIIENSMKGGDFMVSAVKCLFVDAFDQEYKFNDGKVITIHYITVVDDDARSAFMRYVNFKMEDETYKRLQLNTSKVNEFKGKMVQLSGVWTKEQKFKDNKPVGQPVWEFRITDLKLIQEK